MTRTVTSPRRLGRRMLAIAAASSLVLAACGGDDDDADDEGTAADSAEDTAAEAADTAEDTAAESAEDTGAETAEETAEEGDDAGEAFTVAVVAPSASNDLAFTQSMIDSLDRIENLEVDVTDGTFVVEDAAAALRGYAEDGYDLIIAHGTQFGAPLQEIAADFPEQAFAWGTADDTQGLDNVFAYGVRSDQGGYVNGMMAAQLTESGTIGVVGPVEAGDAKFYVDGFVAGATAQDPDVTVNVNYIESFSDVALAAEAATTHVSNGADVLTGTAQMVVGATGVAQENDVPWFGTQSNQTDLGPEIVVASQVYHWEVILEEIMDQIGAGTLGGEVYELTLENGGLVIEFNDAFGLDPAIQSAAEEAAAAIASGEMSTGL